MIKEIQKHADTHGLTVDLEVAQVVVEGLQRNKDLWGASYCPCKLERVDKNICPCEELRTKKICHCGIYKSA
jgi:ferredoxin-thioredoxin reductase catalytic subunit